MKKTFLTKQGQETRELTQEEITEFAELGDYDAKKEILKQEKAKAKDIEARLTAVEKYLGV